MKSIIKYILITIVLFAVAPIHAEQRDIKAEFESRLTAASSSNRTIVARFTQRKSVPGIKEEVERSGDFYYDNSGDMAMIYDAPEGDKVVMNGDNFTIVVGGKRITSTSDNPMMAQISYMMQASMLGDVEKLGRGWDLTITFVEAEAEYRVVVKPVERRIKRYITAMTMAFDLESMTLATLRIDESSGGFTSYDFHSKQINADIDSVIFKP